MRRLWLPPRYRRGFIFTPGDCQCHCESPFCFWCNAATEEYDITLAGIADSTCTNCDTVLNGTHRVTHRPITANPCQWDITIPGVCGSNTLLRLHIIVIGTDLKVVVVADWAGLFALQWCDVLEPTFGGFDKSDLCVLEDFPLTYAPTGCGNPPFNPASSTINCDGTSATCTVSAVV